MKPSMKEQLLALKPELDAMLVEDVAKPDEAPGIPKQDGTGPRAGTPECSLAEEVEKEALSSDTGAGEALIPQNDRTKKIIQALDMVQKCLYALERVSRDECE